MIIAGIVLGPERIVMAARWLGRTTSQLQGISRSFFRQLNAEIDNIDQSGELKETMEELNQLRRQVDDLRKEFVGIANNTNAEIKQSMQNIETDARSIAPPSILNAHYKSSTNGEAYPPPSLPKPVSDSESPPTSVAVPPSNLPQRVSTADDPE
ncbi:MAG: hypothetical protein R3C44_05680 [Chloroflexota bacterium]